jgi:hypothetical protein
MNNSSRRQIRYVILRDDDTNALTPVECLERLYRPFLNRGLPVNLAVIPEVHTRVTLPNGRPEGYLPAPDKVVSESVPIGLNQELVHYLRRNPGYHAVQHGHRHTYFEFDRQDPMAIGFGLDRGSELFAEAGLPRPRTFVAPYDKFSRASLAAAAKRFAVISTGWFELRRLPPTWWPRYFLKKLLRTWHWRIGRTILLSHPGCLLSYQRPYETMLEGIKRTIEHRYLTVLVTHWWEYFREQKPDDTFIQVLHETADFLASDPCIQVVSFEDMAQGRVPLC